jgi:xanthine dehydrogenase YagS FAD-binding subunit
MKTFANVSPRDMRQAVATAQQAHHDGKTASFVGGGSDLLALVKERIVTPDVVISLKSIAGGDRVANVNGGGVAIGGLMTLNALSRDATVLQKYPVLAQAAESVATPQIRNVGTLAGNVCQRPWCWYFRNGFPCYKAGGNQCFSFSGENQFHAIFGGGPSYIVHPSDTAVAHACVSGFLRSAAIECGG